MKSNQKTVSNTVQRKRMYKSKKMWVVAGVAGLTFGSVLLTENGLSVNGNGVQVTQLVANADETAVQDKEISAPSDIQVHKNPDHTVTVTGKADPNAIIGITDSNGNPVGAGNLVHANDKGEFAFNLNSMDSIFPLPEDRDYTLSVYDENGVNLGPSASFTITSDKMNLKAPSNITLTKNANGTITVHGKADPNVKINIFYATQDGISIDSALGHTDGNGDFVDVIILSVFAKDLDENTPLIAEAVDPNFSDSNVKDSEPFTFASNNGKTTTPSKGDDADKPSKGDDADKPSKGDDADKPSKGDDADKPSKGDDTDKPSKGDDADKPSKGDDADKPSKGDDADKPSKGDDADKPSKGDDADKPLKGDDADKPSKGDDADKPLKDDDADNLLKDENAAAPAKNDGMNKPSKDENVVAPAKNDDMNKSSKNENVETSSKTDAKTLPNTGDESNRTITVVGAVAVALAAVAGIMARFSNKKPH